MANPTIRIHDMATGEVIDREMNDSEFAQYQLDKAEQARESAAQAAAQAAKDAAQSKLEVLGLTTDDLKALGL